MVAFRQTFLKPGRYHFGSGVYREVSREDLSSYVDGTRRLLASSYQPPILYEHAEPGSDEGSPRQFSTIAERDRRAKEVKNGTGWMTGIQQNADGSVDYTLDVTDSEAARKLCEGSIKFTSPELRPLWVDGKGVAFPSIVAHVALTHRPRNPDQSAIQPIDGPQARQPAMQFSLADLEEPIQMANDDEDRTDDAASPDTSDTPPEPNPDSSNPDLPKTNLQDQQQFEALLAYLEEHGFALPANTTPENLVERMLTAAMTKSKADQMAKEEAAAGKGEDDDLGGQITEESPPAMLFSVSDVKAGGKVPAVLGELITLKAQRVEQLFTSMVDRGALTPAAKNGFCKPQALQFSVDGKAAKTYTLEEVADILNDALPDGFMFSPSQFSATAKEETHPGGDVFLKGSKAEDMSDEKAEEIANAQTKRFNAALEAAT